MADWYSRAREKDGRTDEEVMAEIEYRRVNPPLGTGSDDSVRVFVGDTGAGTPLTAVEQAYFDGFKGGLDDEPSHWDDTNEEIAEYAREYARSRPARDQAVHVHDYGSARIPCSNPECRPATDPAGLDALRSKRFDIGGYDGDEITPSPEGEYVLWEDVKAALSDE